MNVVNVICLIIISIGILLMIFLIYDICYSAYNWQARIHIGKWNGIEAWSQAIGLCAEKWIKRTPVVPKNDNSRLLLWDKLMGAHENNTIQSWQIAGLLMGLESISFGITPNYIKKLVITFKDNPNVDRALLAYALLNQDNYDDYSRSLVNEFADSTKLCIIDVLGNNATVPYRKANANIRYVDTLGFICPFLISYGALRHEYELLKLSERQITEYRGFLHPILKLPPHAYNIDNNCPMGVYDWGRGVGWYILALIESRRALIKYNYNETEFYHNVCSMIKELTDIVIGFQKNNGGFSMFLTDIHGQYESSATVMCGLLFIDAFEITGNHKYLEASRLTIKALMEVTQRSGAIDLCQGDTKGMGLYSSRLAIMPFVQGLAVMLAKRYGSHA